jgi:hypothetical protein
LALVSETEDLAAGDYYHISAVRDMLWDIADER